MSIWRWSDLLPETPDAHQFSLGEGNSPLIASRQIGPETGLNKLYFKLEGSNPTGSYKDRFAAAAISHMRCQGQSLCLATSSGNTGSALAAYCAAASIECSIAVVEPAPEAKLLQMLAYGARVLRVRGFGVERSITEQTFHVMESLGRREGVALQISAFKYSPFGMAGVQTIAYEIARELQRIGHVFVPTGGGGLTLAAAKGFQRLVEARLLGHCPRVHCVQPAGNDTIASPLRQGLNRAVTVNCTTSISGLQVPSVIDGDDAMAACRVTGGTGYVVSDDEVYAVQRRLARCEGIFCEPAGAVATTAALAAVARGEVDRDEAVVCLVTGSGFKDLASVERMSATVTYPTIDCDRLEECILSSGRSD
jgi:threonine synthase